ncbi:MAG TPA: hypothetical protein VMT89_01230 [Candidatus Acidoferrales bacterium]|nr:hypothetical protein [Candidatus Acidoferrales bacterium]
MHITMVKKKMKDDSDCRKCSEVTEHLKSRGLWDRIDEVLWAVEGDPQSPGMVLGQRLGVERAPFFVVRDGNEEKVYLSVLQLIRERLGETVNTLEEARDVDPDDIGGI